MSKEVIAAISHTYELASYSTSELRSLFDDWLGAIEQLVIGFVNRQKKADPDEIATHLNLQRTSAIFVLSKLAREGKVTMQAAGNGERKNNIKRLRTKK
ncbi:MAG: hypothetical protein M0022_00360 [Desulfobacteraceae bacterium]|nr:hypothetical protein [Desulfobacteraceae bacterium]